jgi:hypothetical protein
VLPPAARPASMLCQRVWFCSGDDGREAPMSYREASPAATQEPMHGTTGGGFSNLSPRPPWQEAAVAAYLAALPPGATGCVPGPAPAPCRRPIPLSPRRRGSRTGSGRSCSSGAWHQGAGEWLGTRHWSLCMGIRAACSAKPPSQPG